MEKLKDTSLLELFDHDIEYRGNILKINTVKDTLFQNSAFDEKETVSAMNSFYGEILAYKNKQLRKKEKEKACWMAVNRENAIENILSREEKQTEVGIISEYNNLQEYKEFDTVVNDLQYEIEYLEKAIWSVKSKSEHVKALLSLEAYTG